MHDTRKQIAVYIRTWKQRGYSDDIPDEVPAPLMRENLAPSYKAICLALMRNDVALTSIGFQPKPCESYNMLKRIEIAERKANATRDDTIR